MTARLAVVTAFYRERGWPGVLPLPERAKTPPLAGTTGRTGVDLDDHALATESARRGLGNVGLRLPRGVLGVDVDDYGNKHGALTLEKAEAVYGALPATWSTGNRGWTPSRIRYYQVSPEVEFPGILAVGEHSDVELIQFHHRYAVVAPSVHPDGRTYHWYSPGGQQLDARGVPSPEDLPWLPGRWQDALSGPVKPALQPADPREVAELVARLEAAQGMCSAMSATLTDRFTHPVPGARHDATRNHVLRLLRLGERGHRGADQAIDTLRGWFLAEVGSDRAAEFQRFVDGGLQVIARDITPSSWRRCCSDVPRKAML